MPPVFCFLHDEPASEPAWLVDKGSLLQDQDRLQRRARWIDGTLAVSYGWELEGYAATWVELTFTFHPSSWPTVSARASHFSDMGGISEELRDLEGHVSIHPVAPETSAGNRSWDGRSPATIAFSLTGHSDAYGVYCLHGSFPFDPTEVAGEAK